MLAQAQVVAEYEVELARIRFVKVALIERAMSLGTKGPAIKTKFIAERFSASAAQDNPKNTELSETMLTTVAVQRALPELRKIQRTSSEQQHSETGRCENLSGVRVGVTRR